jgi:hypothetical protein
MNPQMIAMLAKSLGIDFNAITGQAAQIGEVFTALRDALARIEANQLTIMAHLGCYIPPVTPATEAMVADGLKQLQTTWAGGASLDNPVTLKVS